MKKLFAFIMLLVSIVMLSYGKQNVTTRYFNVECEEQWQTNTIMIEDDNTIIYSIRLLNDLGIYKKWESSGNIVIIDSTNTTARFYSNGPLKGRIYYYFDDDPANPCKCGLGSVSLDVYKHFDAAAKYGVEIIGQDCLADGDSVVFSIKPILTANLYAGIGMDLYNWNIFDTSSAPYVESIPYVSGDSSSVTFKVGTMTGNDSISIRVGMANEEYRIVKHLGKAAPKPIVNDTCLPYDQSSFEVNVFNEDYPDLIYDWTWPTNWQIQYIDNVHKSRVRLSTKIIGEEGTFSVTSSYSEQSGECAYASQASFNLTRSWGRNPYITPADTIVVNNSDFIEFELKDAYLTENSYPTWTIPTTWEFEGDEHHSTFRARPVNSTNFIDSIIVWEDVCNHRDSAKVYVYIRPKQVLSITDHGCLEDGEYTFTAQSFSVGPEPVSYIWVYGGDTIKESTGSSVSIDADMSKSSLSVTSIGRYGYNSETTTFNLKYRPEEPVGIVLHNECIAYNMIDTVKLSILNPVPNQKYAWTPPAGWTMYDTIGSLDLDTCVRMLSNGTAGPHIVYAKGVNEDNVDCPESISKEQNVTINSMNISVNYLNWNGQSAYQLTIQNATPANIEVEFYEDGVLIPDVLGSMFNFIMFDPQCDRYSELNSLGDLTNNNHYSIKLLITTTDNCKTQYIYGAPLNNNNSMPQQRITPLRNERGGKVNHTLILSPNPTNTTLRIQLSDVSSEPVEVTIIDFEGRIIKQGQKLQNGDLYNVSNLPMGQYIVRVMYNNRNYMSTFIKQ